MYLEVGVIPIRYVLASRRLSYHQTILQRDDSELTKRIYLEQRKNPTSGDFVQLIAADFRLINENQDYKEVMMTNSSTYKKQIRIKILHTNT